MMIRAYSNSVMRHGSTVAGIRGPTSYDVESVNMIYAPIWPLP